MADDVIVNVAEGKLRGAAVPGGYRFLGIPFAASPEVTGRFGPPMPHPRWDGIRDALRYGATAAQPERGVTIIPEPIYPGDNCLNLNISTPELGEARLPVLVWIHGGGFFSGCNSSPWYIGSSFVRDGVVVVSINYRLGAEGFMHLDDAPANRGVLDWIAALRWVQQNIGVFGGDPGRVTIAGQSAGGAACGTLLGVPEASDLFAAAICMSGAARFHQTAADADTVASEIAAELGVRPLRADMEAVPAERLIEAQQVVIGGMTLPATAAELGRMLQAVPLRLVPYVDGTTVPGLPLAAIRAGAAKGKAIMAGTTAHEFNMVALGQDQLSAELARAALIESGLAPAAAGSYLSSQPDKRPSDIVGQVLTDRVFRLPAQELLSAQASTGGPAYHYQFDWPSATPVFAGLSFHCLDLPFAFDILDADGVGQVTGPNPPQELATSMHDAWVRFVTGYAPGWQGYDEKDRAGMIFGARSALATDPLGPERARWPEG